MIILLILTIISLAWCALLTRHISRTLNKNQVLLDIALNRDERMKRLERAHKALLEDHIALAVNLAHVESVHLGLKATEHVFSSNLKP